MQAIVSFKNEIIAQKVLSILEEFKNDGVEVVKLDSTDGEIVGNFTNGINETQIKDIIRYKPSMPIRDIIDNVFDSSLSKYTEYMEEFLEEEVPVVDNALREFAKDMGIIQSKDKQFKIICTQRVGHTCYLKFYDIENKEYIIYYDLEEIDKRYIDMEINNWKNA